MFKMDSQMFYVIMTAVAAVLAATGVAVIVSGHMIAFPQVKYISQGSAGIDAVINAPSYTVSYLNVNITGNNTKISVPVNIISRCFVSLPVSPGNISQQPIPKIITTTVPGAYIEPCNVTEQVVFTGLRPYSIYNVSIEGSESPYCPPGVFCPLFVLHVQKNLDVETAANDSIVSVKFSV